MYIKAAAGISPQISFEQILSSPEVYSGNRLKCAEPDYAKLIDARMIRRMSRIIKMGVVAAKDCLQQVDITNPGAIITGTAYGCLADTELFLSKMVENNEELLTPTSFIQSTHNTVGAQVALMLKCHNYNNTFVHRGFSFESALLDAISLLQEGNVEDVLVGAVDEITDTSHALLSRFGIYKAENTSSIQLFSNPSKGTIAGEGSAFFVLANTASGSDYAKLNGIDTLYRPSDVEEVSDFISNFLNRHNLKISDIDVVLTGNNGDINNDKIYTSLNQSIFKGITNQPFKQYCGEYPTATAFALWLAVNIIKSGKLPADVAAKSPKKILIYNHYLNIHHSIYLLSAC